jgi:MFS superfamily sulfate permease-like transporter
LILVGIAIVAVSVLSLDEKGVDVVGQVDRALPLPAIPTTIHFSDLETLLPGTLAIVIIGYSESVSVAEQFAEEHRYEIRPNQELAALGVSSALSGLFQGFIAGGGASQSAANDRAGARTQVAGIVLAVLALLTSVLLMPLFKNLPSAVLGAIVISAVMGFLNVSELRRIVHLSRESFVFAAIALVGVLFLGILPGLLLTVALTVVMVLGRLSRPRTSLLARIPGTRAFVDAEGLAESETEPGLLIFRLDAPLMFINATWMRDALHDRMGKAEPPLRVVLLDLGFSSGLDIKGLDVLTGLARDLRQQDAELWLANVHRGVLDVLQRGGLAAEIGESRIYRTIADAVSDFRSAPTRTLDEASRPA